MIKRFFLIGLTAAMLITGLFAISPVAHAQTANPIMSGLNVVGANVSLPSTDPRILIGRIINVVLSLLAIILLILILYAGFLWMTAGGNADQIAKAKAYIRNAIIGVIIILCSWALARYILTKLIQAAGGTGGTTTGGGGPPGGGGFGTSGSSQFHLIAITPNGAVGTKKVIVKIVFNKPLDATTASAADAVIVTKTSDGTRVAGTTEANGSVMRFHPNNPCPAPNTDKFCFDDNTEYTVTVSPTVRSSTAEPLTCGGFAPACTGRFQTGSAVIITPPTIVLTYPLDGFGVSANALINVTAFAQDDVGIGYVDFSANGTNIGNDAPIGATPKQFSAHAQWDTTGIAPGTPATLQSTAYNVDSGSASTPDVHVIVRAASCFNGRQDGTETGIDCGGNPASPTFCGACSGGACTQNTDCASGMCVSGTCVDQPIITTVSPQDGAPGSYVTITGANFGSNGYVTFLGSTTPVRANPPAACTAQGAATWSPTQIVVEVPTGAQNGPIRVTNNMSSLSDDTNAAPGPAIADFVVNNVQRPGICAVDPVSSPPGQIFHLYGTSFGAVSAGVNFGPRTLATAGWTNSRIDASVPNIAVGTYPISVTVGALTSNSVTMNVTGATSNGSSPQIVEISPAAGPVGTYVTLTGTSFGTAPGQVFFTDTNGQSVLADTNFPSGCAASFWTDTSVIVKVPKTFTTGGASLAPGTYTVYLKTANPTAPASNRVNFSVNTNPLAPGICSIIPRTAPVGTAVQINGEGFTPGPGTVMYYRNAVGTATSWTNGSIASVLPATAQTGPVVVRPQSSGLTSNPYNIQVRNCNEAVGICSSTEECCTDGSCRIAGSCSNAPTRAMYAWQFSTGIIPHAPEVVEQCGTGSIPSPAPWSQRDGGQEVCTNEIMVMLFTTYVDPASVSLASNHVLLQKCTGSGATPCAQTSPAPIRTSVLTHADATQDVLEVTPQSLDVNSWYQVVLTTGVRGLGDAGLPMKEHATKCGAGNAYCYTFKTRADASPCEIGNILVAPNPYTAQIQNEQIPYDALPQPKGDICRVLTCDPYNWSWNTSDSRATITNAVNADNPSLISCHQVATAISETGPTNPVQVTAAAMGVTGAGNLYIRYTPPQVTDKGPNCDTACLNAAIWAQFNVPINPSSVNLQNIVIERCKNEACQESELLSPARVDLSQALITLRGIPGTSGTEGRFLVIEPRTRSGAGYVSLLEAGHYYRVLLLGGSQTGIVSTSNVPLTGLNAPDGYAWTFRVKAGDNATCKPEKMDISPLEKFERIIGDRTAFSATPSTAPDSCSAKGQILMSLDSYAWSIADTNVAILLSNGTQTSGAIDTGTSYPVGCTEKCLASGAQGVVGKVARCGNGAVDTPFEECDGQTGCNDRCLWDAVPTVAQGGTCGDGVLQSNEACDFGRTCQRVPFGSTVLEGSNCTSAAAAASCQAAGGTCDTRITRGCSANCRHLGASAAGSTCGNGDISDGEDCDDGNTQNGDGCSANCLHEGSSKTITSICGNGVLEPGETCEKTAGGPWPIPSCNPKTCLNVGVYPCVSRMASGAVCCGNGRANELGKDCDDGNTQSGDGCSSICLLEGSSYAYSTPSFCRDGRAGTGELAACEAPVTLADSTVNTGPDGMVDATQIGQAVGKGTPDASGLMSTQITAVYSGVTAQATYGLRCGNTSEQQCSSDGSSVSDVTGLTNNGCCSARPILQNVLPTGSDVCRNALIRGSFNELMDVKSLSDNFVVAEVVQGTACPNGTQVFTRLSEPRGFFAWVSHVWKSVIAFFRPNQASAQSLSCVGGVTGKLQFITASDANGNPYTQFAFTLDHVLAPDTSYRVIFKGDHDVATNKETEGKAGIRNALGVVVTRDFEWSFLTGKDICTITHVRVEDQNLSSPQIFTKAQEAHPFIATALSRRASGVVASISPTAEYAWEWQNWVLSNRQIATLDPASSPGEQDALSSRTVSASTASGSGLVVARVHITADTASVPSTVGDVVQGTAPITVNICENPWPSKADAPFRDEAASPSLDGTLFQNGPYFNFSMMYCRDAGEPGTLGDLPELNIHAIAPATADSAQGIARQYLFTFTDASMKKDAIGVRIAGNPLHLSPREWYASKGFTGNPTETTVDGYQAIRDGRTVYVAFANTDGPQQNIYSNIFIISYNDGAEPTTRQIYDALLSSLTFNRNVQGESSNACETSNQSLVTDSSGASIPCDKDTQCQPYGAGDVCANIKAKLQRDLVRLADFQKMSRLIESVKSKTGNYPTLASGSYVGALSTSLWPSWTDALQKIVGTSLPTDPVNRFVTCGLCGTSKAACVSDSDCPSGDSCQAQGGYDPKTCWNQSASRFLCPSGANGAETSHVYMYRAIANGAQYELDGNFEVQPPNAIDPTVNWWQPPLMTTVKRCSNTGAQGNFCSTDTDCQTCTITGVCTSAPTGACKPAGASFVYGGSCKGGEYGQSSVCGDGVVDPSNSEVCETTGPTATRLATCSLSGGETGLNHEICAPDCKSYVIDPKNAACTSVTTCGNGKREGSCSNNALQPCVADAECGTGGSCQLETCDDGVLNGTYGHCNKSCNGYGAYCGDGLISGGEVCDNGSANKEWTLSSDPSSCNFSCTGPAGYCGNTKIEGPESCDGGTQSTDKALCSWSQTPCSTASDCPSGESCGGSSETNACAPTRVCVGGTNSSVVGKPCTDDTSCSASGATCSSQTVPTKRSRSCGVSSDYNNACQWDHQWGSCLPSQSCGNGIQEGAEQCDDGNQDDTDGCTKACLKNVCGDSHLYTGVEECDNGTSNGSAVCSAEYGSTCPTCSKSCKIQLTQGGFCGDGIVNTGSSEQCDGNATVKSSITCQALGYDYMAPAGGACSNDPTKLCSTNTDCGTGNTCNLRCSQSCTYTGCAMCGQKPTGTAANDPMYQGKVEGIAYDTVSQQPVPNARVTLFYRGIQVAVVTTDAATGYFAFTGLDRHVGCGQYRIVIDSYTDNPLTTLIDEGKRGGYMVVQTPPFSTYLNGSNVVGSDSQVYLQGMTDPGIAVSATNPKDVSYKIPQFSMIPRLKENEYIVQFWWDPTLNWTSISSQDMTDAFRSAVSGQSDPVAAANGFYSKPDIIDNLHDLVVRLPFAYTPGTFGRCTLSPKPDPYKGDGRNKGEDATTGYPLLDASGNYSWKQGISGVDHQDPLFGMVNCTNKIRATAGRTCTGGSVPSNFAGKLACSLKENYECMGWSTNKYEYANSTCSGPADGGAVEPSRSGPLSVLSGGEGAYLFCNHPEWPDAQASKRSESSCTNFIIPPQSVFIHGNGGQYDILVTAFHQFNAGSHNPQSIKVWLAQHNGQIRLYDQYGLNKIWKENDLAAGTDLSAGWNKYDGNNVDVCMTGAGSRDTGSDTLGKDLKQRTFYHYGNVLSSVWTPISIDTTAQRVMEWNNGATGADYHYFADLYTFEFEWFQGSCWERTCSGMSLTGGGTFPTNLNSGQRVCADQYGKYGNDFNNLPACDNNTATTACPSRSYCATHINAGTRCIKACTWTDPYTGTDASHPTWYTGTDPQCGANAYCGGYAGVCGSADVTTGRGN